MAKELEISGALIGLVYLSISYHVIHRNEDAQVRIESICEMDLPLDMGEDLNF
ncbi:MAG: hypothetical protein KDI79_10715 [Anaerolineae bacterium]|nr:hypothetical protein [Anaerolineae bacterium]